MGVVLAGLLLIALAGLGGYAAWWLHSHIGGPETSELLRKMRQITMDPQTARTIAWVGLGLLWLAYGTLAVAGLVTLARRRFAWGLLGGAAAFTIVASAVAAAGAWFLQRYGGYAEREWLSYALPFLVLSTPGWILLGASDRQRTGRSILVALLVGLFLLAVAGLVAYAAWRLRAYIIRLNSFRAFDTLLAPREMQAQLGAGIAVSEVTVLVWMVVSWIGALLLALAGLWTLVRGRFAWRLLWIAAIGILLDAVLTVVAGQIMERYALYPHQNWRIYLAAFLVHSCAGWMVLGMWLLHRLAQPKRPVPAAESADQNLPEGQSSSPDPLRDNLDNP